MKIIQLLFLQIIILNFVVFPQNTHAQSNKKPIHIELGKTLGFLMGQQITLDRIKAEYPELSLDAHKADLEFKNSFGISEKNIKSSLKKIMKNRYSDLIISMKNKIDLNLMSQQINQEMAKKFVIAVELRSKGEIPSPFLETLLNYQFQKKPVNEFIQGFRLTYRTKGHKKSKGLDFQIEYPKSWSSREGKRPNIIQFFSSSNGRGPAFVLFMTRDLMKVFRRQFTSKDIEYLLTLKGSREFASEAFSKSNLIDIAKGMGMSNVRNLSVKRIVMDRWPAAMIGFIGDQQRLDLTITMYNIMYVAIYKNYMVFLQCQVTKWPNETERMFQNKISKFTPLFYLIANSLIIQSQY